MIGGRGKGERRGKGGEEGEREEDRGGRYFILVVYICT